MGLLQTQPPSGPAETSDMPSLTEVALLSREQLVDRLLHFRGSCQLDFTESFLATKSTDKLRHILVAACQHAGQLRD